MLRVLLPLGIATVGLIVALILAGDLGGENDLESETDSPLAQEDAARAAAEAAAGADGPTLATTNRPLGPGETRRHVGGSRPGGKGAGPHGPYVFAVTDAARFVPLADAVVTHIPDAASPETPANEPTVLGETNDDGLLEVAEAGTARLAFRVRKAGFVEYRGRATPGERETIELHPGVAIQGTVVRGRGRAPVADAGVRVWDVDLDREIATTTSDAKGRFTLHAVRPHHPVVIITTAPGLTPTKSEHLFDELSTEVVLAVGSGGRIEGRVVGTDGTPQAGLQVLLFPKGLRLLGTPEEGWRSGAAQMRAARMAVILTDADGAFVFEDVALNEWWRVVAFQPPRHLIGGSSLRLTYPGEARTVELKLTTGATLEVELQDGKGAAMSHADLTIRSREGEIEVSVAERFVDGILTLPGLTPGSYDLTASLPGYPEVTGRARIRDGETERVVLRFKGGGEVFGSVKDKRGAPIWKARVAWRGTHGSNERVELLSDDKGRFQFKGLQASQGLLTVSARDLPHTTLAYESWKLEGVKPGEGRTAVTLKDGTYVRGRFVDLPPGTAVSSRMLAGATPHDAGLKLGKDGGFKRRGPEPRRGATMFAFYARGFAPLLLLEKTPFHSEEVRDLGPLTFEKTNAREGKVVGPGQRALHGARVSILAPWSERATRTDRDGDFVFARVPDEDIMVRVEAKGFPTVRFRLLTASQFRRQVMRMPSATTLRVEVVVGPRKVPIGRATVRLESTGRGLKPLDAIPLQQEQRTDRRGEVSFLTPPGHYRLTVTNPRTHQATRTTVRVASRGLTTETIRLRK